MVATRSGLPAATAYFQVREIERLGSPREIEGLARRRRRASSFCVWGSASGLGLLGGLGLGAGRSRTVLSSPISDGSSPTLGGGILDVSRSAAMGRSGVGRPGDAILTRSDELPKPDSLVDRGGDRPARLRAAEFRRRFGLASGPRCAAQALGTPTRSVGCGSPPRCTQVREIERSGATKIFEASGSGLRGF